jgi:thiol:disulfide interchange protein DsbC
MKRMISAAWPGILVFAVLIFSGLASAQCPPQQRVEELIAKFESPERRLISLRSTDYSGLCEVHIQLNSKTHIFYTDPTGDYFLMGQLYDSASGRNVTRETIEASTFFSPEEMRQLNDLSVVSIGTSGKVIYFATDPHCPYCKKGEEILDRMAQSGEVTVRILFFPLDSYKDSRQRSISVICDKKSLVEFHNGYTSENQCADGIRIVDATKEILSQKGVSGTPAYIFPDRRFHTGLLDEAEFRRRLGLAPAEPAQKKPSTQKAP